MRNPAGAVFGLFLTITFGVPGILLGTWVALRQFRIAWAFDWAMWVATHSGIPFTLPPVDVANIAIQTPSVILAAVCALVLCALALICLRSARLAMRAADESQDGKARISLKTEPLRVGRPVEGSLRLTKDPEPGELFVVRLGCTRFRGDHKSSTETAYFEEQRTPAARGAHGWSVPFRFDIPATAPATGAPTLLDGRTYQYQWKLELRPAKSWSPFSTWFDLVLGPAPVEELRAVEDSETSRPT